MDSETMDRLQLALEAEAEAKQVAHQVQQRLDAARAVLADAKAERAATIAAIAVGSASILDLAAIDRAAEEVGMYEQALLAAQRRLADVADALNVALAAIVQQKAERARADYEAAGQAYLQAAQNRNAAAARMNSLERAGTAYENAKARVHAMITSPRPIAQLGDEMNQHLMNLELQAARRDIETAGDVLRTICQEELADAAHHHAGAEA